MGVVGGKLLDAARKVYTEATVYSDGTVNADMVCNVLKAPV